MRPGSRGFTLIELLVSGIVVMLLASGVGALFKRVWDNHDAVLTQNYVQRQARQALDMACDELRTISLDELEPGRPAAVAYTDDRGNSVVGQDWVSAASTQFVIRLLPDRRLVRLQKVNNDWEETGSSSSVRGIDRFQVRFIARKWTTTGSLEWTPLSIENRPPDGPFDPRILRAAFAVVSATASQRAANGITYSCTLESAVKLRNQAYPVAPPSVP